MARHKYRFGDRKEAEEAYRKADNEALRFRQAVMVLFGGNAGKPYKPMIHNDRLADGTKFAIAVIPSPRGVSEGVVVVATSPSKQLPTVHLVEDYLREIDGEIRRYDANYGFYDRIRNWLRAAWPEAAEEMQRTAR